MANNINFPLDANGLVAWWKLDDASGTNANDSIGTNDGTLSGTPTWTTGIKGGALSLDGIDDSINCGNSDLLCPQAITVSAWVKMTSLLNNTSAAYNAIVSRHGGGYYYQILVKSNGKVAIFTTSPSNIAYDGTGAYTLAAGSWYHLVLTYDSTKGLYGYVNGNIDARVNPDSTLSLSTGNTHIGFDAGTANRYPNAIVDDVRLYNRALSPAEVKSLFAGSPYYQATVSQNATPIAGYRQWVWNGYSWRGGFDDDPYAANTVLELKGEFAGVALPATLFSQVKLLLHADGANNSTTITDSSAVGATFTAAGDAKLTTDHFKFGTTALKFDGTGGDYVTATYVTANYDWWTEDYTVEAWVYYTTFTNASTLAGGQQAPCLIGNMDPASGTVYWSFGPDINGKVAFYYYTGLSLRITSSATVPLSTWTHIAMCKKGSGIEFFINGVADDTNGIWSVTPQSSAATAFTLGQFSSAEITAWVDDVRIIKGQALYTGNFTVPSLPFSDSNNSSTPVIVDTSPLVVTITPTTNVSVSRTQSKFGSTSLYFNGANAFLTTPYVANNHDWWTQDTTIEMWIYPDFSSGQWGGALPSTLGNMTANDGFASWSFGPFAAGNLAFYYSWSGGAEIIQSTNNLVVSNTWNHIAMCSNASTNQVTLFVNGIAVKAAIANNPISSGGGNYLTLGQWVGPTGIVGYVDNLKITKGIARYKTPVMDLIANCVAGYSFRKLKASYTGAAVRVRRSSDDIEQDIGFIGNTSGGSFDYVSAVSFIGSGNGYIKTWYDQSGNANNVSNNAGESAQAQVLVARDMPVRSHSAMTSYFTTPYLYTTTAPALTGSAFTISLWLKRADTTGDITCFKLGSVGAANKSITLSTLNGSATSFKFSLYDDDLTVTLNSAYTSWTNITATLDASKNQVVFQDGVYINTRVATALFTGDAVMTLSPANGYLGEVLIFNRVLTNTEIMTLNTEFLADQGDVLE